MKPPAGQVSGHYAGAFTRLAAFVIDWFVIIGGYGLILSSTQFILELLFGFDVNFESIDRLWWWAGFAAWAFLYLTVGLTLTGRSIGKALMGLRVVSREGAPLGPGRAAVRVLFLPLSFTLLGLGFLGILLGRERRALHDVIARTAVVYDWGDRPAEMPAPLTRFLERKGVGVLPPSAETSELETTGT
jgi:uncharacterized RDD family membrane protein YckC